MREVAIELITESFKIKLELTEISSLRPHEGVLEHLKLKLIRSMLEDDVQIDPIIVDEGTGVVLDGAHRLEALRAIGAYRALTCPVDYGDPDVELRRWIRSIKKVPSTFLMEIVEGMSLVPVDTLDRAFELVDSRLRELALLITGGPLISKGFSNSLDGFRYSWQVEQEARRIGADVELIRDVEARRDVEAGNVIIYPAPPTKGEIVDSGLRGELYPPKSTRHILPVRPVNVRLPLKYLLGEGAEGAAEELRTRTRGFRVLPPGSGYGGRVYEGRLVLFGR